MIARALSLIPPTIFKPISDVLVFEGVRVYLAEIGPPDAARILDSDKENRNQQNRKPNTASLKRLMRSAQRGRWRLTHQGIAFDSLGILIDGQHRLTMIVETGIAVRMLVCEGLDPEVRLATDKGSVRGHRDDLRVMGEEFPEIVAAAVNAIRRLGFSDTEKLDSIESAPDRERYRAGLNWVAGKLPSHQRSVFTSASVVGALVFAYPRAASIIDAAYDELVTGAVANPQDAILHLHNQLLKEKTKIQSDSKRHEYFNKTLNALYHRLQGIGTKQLKVSPAVFNYFKSAYPDLARKEGR